jgi:hypothetical protein
LMQAQPNKIRLKEQQEDGQYEEKLLAKAQIVVDSANRIWRKPAPVFPCTAQGLARSLGFRLSLTAIVELEMQVELAAAEE